MTKLIPFSLLALTLAGMAFAQPQIGGGGTCSTSTLSGNYWMMLNSRIVSSSKVLSGIEELLGAANFDGKGNFNLTLTDNRAAASGQSQQLGGTLSISSNCTGTMTVAGNAATFTLVVFNGGSGFNIAGFDSGGDTISGTGGLLPSSCVTATLSGAYALTGNGYEITNHSVSGAATVNGLFQFDGAGKVSLNFNITLATNTFPGNGNGSYSINTPSSCLGTATVTDAQGNAVSLWFAISNANGGDFQFLISGPKAIVSGAAHAVFQNPSQSVSNGASFLSEEASPGSIFSIFGENLGVAGGLGASGLPLPNSLGSTKVTVNGEDAPMFYAGAGQINAQMPLDIKPGLATVVVTNGNVASNAAAINVPPAAPGIFTYGPNDHAVVINPKGATNSDATPAHVGDLVVAYFTGGGPVLPSGTLTTGAAAPFGESPVTDANSITVDGKPASVQYMGLSGGSVGLYQANFVIPQVAAGDHPLVVTVNGVKSKAAVISIAN